jgi:hypothetical protein
MPYRCYTPVQERYIPHGRRASFFNVLLPIMAPPRLRVSQESTVCGRAPRLSPINPALLRGQVHHDRERCGGGYVFFPSRSICSGCLAWAMLCTPTTPMSQTGTAERAEGPLVRADLAHGSVKFIGKKFCYLLRQMTRYPTDLWSSLLGTRSLMGFHGMNGFLKRHGQLSSGEPSMGRR